MSDRYPNLTVRIKLVDLKHSGSSSKLPASPSSVEHVSAVVGSTPERSVRPQATEAEVSGKNGYATGEICINTGMLIATANFENHIEECELCSNRVDLQLDFIETLEVAIYQRLAEPKSEKVRGAMLISTPELNFAVCGEIEI